MTIEAFVSRAGKWGSPQNLAALAEEVRAGIPAEGLTDRNSTSSR